MLPNIRHQHRLTTRSSLHPRTLTHRKLKIIQRHSNRLTPPRHHHTLHTHTQPGRNTINPQRNRRSSGSREQLRAEAIAPSTIQQRENRDHPLTQHAATAS